MPGPSRTPTETLERRGSRRIQKDREDEPRPPAARPTCPKWIRQKAQQEWHRLVPQLENMGILAEVDRTLLARYCQTIAKWQEAEKNVMRDGNQYMTPDGNLKANPEANLAVKLADSMLRMEAQLGIGAAARARCIVTKCDDGEVDKKDRFFTRQDRGIKMVDGTKTA